jgi:benzil reductase ((S)-benzoin forming)
MSKTIVWVSGAVDGLGLGIARNTPYPDARIINISRRKHPQYETVQADLAAPAGWETVRTHFREELASFDGDRVIFIHNAYFADSTGLIGKVDTETYQKGVLVNSAAPLVLGEAFLTAAEGKKFEAGLVLISTGATTMPIPGLAAYAAAKIGVEFWAQVVQQELALNADENRWVVAFRPGGIKTPGAKKNEELDPERWPFATLRKEMGKDFMDIDTAGKRIWSGLPPAPGDAILSLAPNMTTDPAKMFGSKFTYVP